jgi:hypothetical protein
MRAQELELEALLLELEPSRADTWQGATPAEVEQLEQLAGRPLPGLYRWFLSRMGGVSSLQGYPSIDFSARQILSCYANDDVRPDPRFFLIGWDTDDYLPQHLFYDFEHPTTDDARVVSQPTMYGPQSNLYESLRMLLAATEFLLSRVLNLPQQCSGLIEIEDIHELKPLDQVMTRIGFQKPVAADSHAALYDRADASMSLTCDPGKSPSKYLFFELGGTDAGVLRQVLGTLATELKLEVEIEEWRPPL